MRRSTQRRLASKPGANLLWRPTVGNSDPTYVHKPSLRRLRLASPAEGAGQP